MHYQHQENVKILLKSKKSKESLKKVFLRFPDESNADIAEVDSRVRSRAPIGAPLTSRESLVQLKT
jgi:hypothetical protein